MKKSHKAGENEIQLALFPPASTWEAPTEFPDLRNEEIIAFDLETKDPKLRTHGPGTRRQDGYPVGVAIATTRDKWYFPIRHGSGRNLHQESVLKWLRTTLRGSCPKVGANILYDLEWLDYLGVTVNGPYYDVQNAEPLIDEEAPSYALNALCRKYLGETKDEDLLREAAEAFGVDPKAEMWKLDPIYVGPYAEADAFLTLQVFLKQQKLLKDQGLWKIFELETALVPCLLEMRKLGVKVDVKRAQEFSVECEEKIDALQQELNSKYGFPVNVNSTDHLVTICEKEDWEYPRTEKGNPSFDKTYLKYARSNTMKKVKQVRELRKLKSDYVDKLILDFNVRGRIYANFNQLGRTKDDGSKEGARSGRFSSSRPNLQQVPSRNELAPIVRGFFIPDDNRLWAKLDYSQQEPRILVHYAYLMNYKGAEEARQAYVDNPKMDFYQFVADQTGLERKPAKDLTLGICYGEGMRKIAHDLDMSVDAAKELLNQFQERAPYIREIYNSAMKRAKEVGFIKTIRSRHRHFNLWEPKDTWIMRDEGWDVTPVDSLEEAKEKWPEREYTRAFTYKALNAIIQGSAADMTKEAMLQVYEKLGLVPHMQVHDELNYSVKNRYQAMKIKEIMETCIPELTVPMYADLDLGTSWK